MDPALLTSIVVPILAIMAPVFGLFLKHDKEAAFDKLLQALPDVWAVVQQERRKGVVTKAAGAPLERGVEIAEQMRGKRFNAAELARVQTSLRAIHERKGAPTPTVSVTVPGVVRSTSGPTTVAPR